MYFEKVLKFDAFVRKTLWI